MNSANHPPENLYAAPQADVGKPKLVYVNKFNGKLAFWSAVLIGAVMIFLCLPEVQTHCKCPPTAFDYLFVVSMIAILSTSVGLYLGSVSGKPVPEQNANTEEPQLK